MKTRIGAANQDEMNKMIFYCGLTCADCPTFIATQNHDDRQRQEVASDWSKIYKFDLKPQDINCDGCRSESGRLFNHCQVCEIRKCAMGKNLPTCAACGQYPCSKLLELFKLAPQAKANLDRINAQGQAN